MIGKKTGFLMAAVLTVFALSIWGMFVCRVNQRYPDREVVYERNDQWTTLSSGLEIRVNGYYFIEDADIRRLEGVPSEQLYDEEMKLICVEYTVRNRNEETVKDNLAAQLPLQTSGWWNYPNPTYLQGNIQNPVSETEVKPGETVEITFPYLFLKSNFRGKGWQEIETRKYAVVLSLYPQKRMITVQ